MQEKKEGEMVEEEVIEEVIEDKPEDKDELDNEFDDDGDDDDDDFVEEEVVEEDDDFRTVELDSFDCGECLEINKKKDEVAGQVNLVAGEIERKKMLLSKLMEKEIKLQEQFELKKQEFKVRYRLVDEYKWSINLFEGTAVGKRQETD